LVAFVVEKSLMIRMLSMVVMLLLCIGIAGCGGNAKTMVAVTGKVTAAGGKAVDNALVVFHPQDAGKVNGPKPFAKTDASGNFKLTTDVEGDGAEPGNYGVTIVWQAAAKETKMSLSGEGASAGADVLKGKYANPGQPLIKAEVKAGEPNTFEWTVEP
jgi:hypothetical protein